MRWFLYCLWHVTPRCQTAWAATGWSAWQIRWVEDTGVLSMFNVLIGVLFVILLSTEWYGLYLQVVRR